MIEKRTNNRRVYIPLDLNKAAFLRRFDHVINKYPDITWRNESKVYSDVQNILAQIEIYDQLRFVREGKFDTDENGMICCHSQHATEVVKEIIARLETVDSCEDFPYDVIDELKKEYGL